MCMAKFKIGDRLVATEDMGRYYKKGEEYTIIDIKYGNLLYMEPDDGSCEIMVDKDTASETFEHVASENLKKFTDAVKENMDKMDAAKIKDINMPNRVSSDMVADIIADSEIIVQKLFDNCTMVALQMPNGFVIVETSACVDPANYDEEIGYDICMERIIDKVYELEGYLLASDRYAINEYQDMNSDSCECWDCDESEFCDYWDEISAEYDSYYNDMVEDIKEKYYHKGWWNK